MCMFDYYSVLLVKLWLPEKLWPPACCRLAVRTYVADNRKFCLLAGAGYYRGLYNYQDYSGGSLLIIITVYNGPQNPILIVKANIL